MSDDISDVTVTELPPVDPLRTCSLAISVSQLTRPPAEQNVVDALKKLSRAETVAEKLEAVKGISVTTGKPSWTPVQHQHTQTAVSRKFLAEKGFLLDCVPLVTVALQADDDVSLEKVADVLAEVLKDGTLPADMHTCTQSRLSSPPHHQRRHAQWQATATCRTCWASCWPAHTSGQRSTRCAASATSPLTTVLLGVLLCSQSFFHKRGNRRQPPAHRRQGKAAAARARPDGPC